MINKPSRADIRRKKHLKLRNRISGTASKPRLAVYRSDSNMYAQIIDDEAGHTLVAASSLEKDIKAKLSKTNNIESATLVGEIVAKRAVDKVINEVVFGRGGVIYLGQIKAVTDAAREAGLEL